ncbi:vacuolar protein sorting-associated protein 26C [Rosa chinensis]|uniref:vacuolar protein sorting-associated protein 26C n=1 Tax=Rosa chinensis TaxID=74649 RepID=UPI001AD8A7E1|nr:vacuolar protein sorting-associated protein 26C [Rosa chinensis]
MKGDIGIFLELIEGKIIVKSASSISHYGIRIAVDGSVNLQVRGGTAGVIETLVGAAKPISILNKIVELRPAGKIASGITEIPFSMHIRQPREDNLDKFYETFHGGNINIQYLVTVDISRGYLYKSLSTTMEFIVESDKADVIERPVSPEMVVFYITQDTQRHPLLPQLKSGTDYFSISTYDEAIPAHIAFLKGRSWGTGKGIWCLWDNEV